MKTVIAVALVFCLVTAGFAQDIGWPRQKTNSGGTIVFYQPQIDDWKDFRQLDVRMAVSIKPKIGQATVGVVYMRARTDVNSDTRNVVLSQLEITSTRFPSIDPAGAPAMEQLVKTFLSPNVVLNISLDRLLAELDKSKQVSDPAVAVKNDPPKIFVSYSANAILLLVDGDLVRAPIEKTNLEFVVNTNWDLFFDKTSSKYFLLYEKMWLTAASVEGPWTITTKLSADLSKIPDQPNWADVKKSHSAICHTRRHGPSCLLQQSARGNHHLQGAAGLRENSQHAAFLCDQYAEQRLSSGWRESILFPGRGTLVPRQEPRRAMDLCKPPICRRISPKSLQIVRRVACWFPFRVRTKPRMRSCWHKYRTR